VNHKAGWLLVTGKRWRTAIDYRLIAIGMTAGEKPGEKPSVFTAREAKIANTIVNHAYLMSCIAAC